MSQKRIEKSIDAVLEFIKLFFLVLVGSAGTTLTLYMSPALTPTQNIVLWLSGITFIIFFIITMVLILYIVSTLRKIN